MVLDAAFHGRTTAYFGVVSRSGKNTFRRSGVVTDRTRAQGTCKAANDFCKRYGMQLSVTFAHTFSILETQVMATLWCSRMQQFMELALSSINGIDQHMFSVADIASVFEADEVEALIAIGPSPEVLARIDQLRRMRPTSNPKKLV